jgi:subtilisin family serine protease
MAALACSLFAAGAAQAAIQPDSGVLSPALAELAKPSVQNAPPEQQARDLGVAAEGPGSLQREGDRVLVNIRFEQGAIAALPDLRAAGSQVLDSSRRYQSATVAVDPVDLKSLEGVPGVASVTESRAPLLFAVGEPPCEGGSVISEGLGQLKVDEAREDFGLRGEGVTVGVLSDSYDVATKAHDGSGPIATHAHDDVVSDDLPGPASTCSGQQLPVDVLDEGPSSGWDEGRAMLQIVHDLAPHASLAFATAEYSEESFAQNIERLARPVSEGGAGANVIVDDVAWFEEPFFQDGPVAAAINKVTSEGVVYLTAAGNNNLFDSGGHEIASWEAPEYRDSGGCPPVVEGLAGFHGTHCMDFKPVGGPDRTFGITVNAHATLTVDLQWSEAWNGVNTDLDAFLLSGSEQILAASYEDNSGMTGTQRPVEVVQWANEASTAKTVQLAINRFSGADPRLKLILLENGRGVSATQYPESSGGDVVGPTVFGHAGDASAITLGAIKYNKSERPEEYSSRGPATHYFAAVEGTSPAAALEPPETIEKPDLVATDCGATTFFARLESGSWRFCGTSAAAPHAAAVAALLRQGAPGATPTQIRDAMTGSAVPVGAFLPNAVGAGLLDADAAMGWLGIAPSSEDPGSTVAPPLEEEATPQPIPVAPVVTSPNSPAPQTSQSKAQPHVFFGRHPAKVVRTRGRTAQVAFRFGADEQGAVLLCDVDSGPFHPCPEGFVHRFGLGEHVVRVKARDQAGAVGPTETFRFQVKRRRGA